MLRQFAVAHGVQRLLAYRDGERRLTNFLHLSELLHAARRAPAGYNRHFEMARPGNAGRKYGAARRMRAPSGRRRGGPHLTVHKSKGSSSMSSFAPMSDRTRSPPDLPMRRKIIASRSIVGSGEYKPIGKRKRSLRRCALLRRGHPRHRCTMVWPAGETRNPAGFSLGNGLQPAIESATSRSTKCPCLTITIFVRGERRRGSAAVHRHDRSHLGYRQFYPVDQRTRRGRARRRCAGRATAGS